MVAFTPKWLKIHHIDHSPFKCIPCGSKVDYENIVHFMLLCPAYSEDRLKLFDSVRDPINKFKKLNYKEGLALTLLLLGRELDTFSSIQSPMSRGALYENNIDKDIRESSDELVLESIKSFFVTLQKDSQYSTCVIWDKRFSSIPQDQLLSTKTALFIGDSMRKRSILLQQYLSDVKLPTVKDPKGLRPP